MRLRGAVDGASQGITNAEGSHSHIPWNYKPEYIPVLKVLIISILSHHGFVISVHMIPDMHFNVSLLAFTPWFLGLCAHNVHLDVKLLLNLTYAFTCNLWVAVNNLVKPVS